MREVEVEFGENTTSLDQPAIETSLRDHPVRSKFLLYSVRLLRAIGCLIIVLVTLELCSRIDDTLTDGAPLWGAYDSNSIMTSDQYGAVGIPNSHYLKWKLNSHGYRGPELRWDRERIMCIGASETFGFAESEGMEYPRQLERELNARTNSNRYQVVNVAIPGQSLRSVARRIDLQLTDVKPQIVLIYPSPITYVTDEIADPVDWTKKNAYESHFWSKFFLWVDSMPEWAATLRFKFHIWKSTRHKVVIESVPERNIALFRANLDQVLDRIQKRNIQAVLVTHATRFGKQVNAENFPTLVAWRRFEPTLDYPGYLDLENRINNVMRAEAAARHLTLVDASSQLSGRENFVDFEHFTNHGSHIMADLISDQLLKAQPPSAAANH